MVILSGAKLPLLRRRLLAWFDRHRRDLPWRRDRDPYKIWVSEVMLQQTTVAAVVPYFHRFIATFPNVAALAAAREQDVLHHWQGLGYYRRARHLHAAAKILAQTPEMPCDPQAWACLPGVGRYILGAVLSQAFDCRLPIVDANVARVLCRLFGEKCDPKSGSVQKWLWQTAERMLPAHRVGDFNQALMELGQTVCTPASPSCRKCPIRAMCQAFRDGTQNRIPAKADAKRNTLVNEVAIVVRRGNKLLLVQRPNDAPRWQSMWEFPQTELRPGEAHDAAAARWLQHSTGLTIAAAKERFTVRYAVTRFRMTMRVLEAQARGNVRISWYQNMAWVSPAQLCTYPMSTAQRKIAASIVRESTEQS